MGLFSKLFKKKDKPAEEPKNKGGDSFQAADTEPSPVQAPVIGPGEPVADYDNEILLRGHIGESAGSDAQEEPEKEKEPKKKDDEDKSEPEEKKKAPKPQSEYAQAMRTKIEKEFKGNQ